MVHCNAAPMYGVAVIDRCVTDIKEHLRNKSVEKHIKPIPRASRFNPI